MSNEAGFDVLGFADGKALWTHLGKRGARDALLLLDLQMPPPDGWKLLHDLKRDPALSDLPVVIISGAADQEPTLRLAGIAGFFSKPFVVAELIRVVGHFCQRRTALRAV